MAHVMCPKRWLKVSELLGLFTNEVADERFQNHIFILQGLVLNDFHHKIHCAIFLSKQ